MAIGPPWMATVCGTSRVVSDDTIKIAGKRIEPAEVESVSSEEAQFLLAPHYRKVMQNVACF
jgi:hypothetical protein